jgi:diguanylate cyclase (GGDEF)-like protein/PAS domain S-box-containing protein
MPGGRFGGDQTIAWRFDLRTRVIDWMVDEPTAPSGVRSGRLLRRELLLRPAVGQELDRLLVQCATLGQPFQRCVQYATSEGRETLFNITGNLVVGADGSPEAVVGLAIASTGGSRFAEPNVQPRAVTELQEFGRFGTVEYEAASRSIRFSDAMCRMVGLEPHDTIELERGRELVHPDDLERVRQVIAHGIESQRSVTFDWRLARPDAELRIMRTWMRFGRDATGRLERLVGLVEDVTELAHERNARIAAENKHRRIFESAPMGMAIVTARGPDEGTVVEANDAFVSILGVSRLALIGGQIDWAIGNLGRFREVMAQLASVPVIEIPVTRLRPMPNGVTRSVKGQVTKIDSPDGEPELLIIQIDDVTAMVEAEARLQELADVDDLTRLCNRRRFREVLAEVLAGGVPQRPCGSLLLIDVDRFKWVNDSRGHQAGDYLLRRVADVLRSTMPDAWLGRIAGDEFAVVLPGVSLRRASEDAERLRQRLHETVIDDGSGRPHHITVTIGVAALEGGADVDRAMIAADLAMYQGKQRGRNRVEVISDPDINERMSTSMSWSERVRQALADGSFELWQQPIINLRTWRVGKRELLLRMIGEDGERIPAAQFMTAAEDFGLAPEVDSWVLEHLAPLAREHQAREPGVLLTVNLSAQSIVDPSLAGRIDAALAERAINPRDIMFEITETAAIADLDAAEALVRTLRDRDYGISIDDFGVGYGSFTYLQRLPFECVKIDRTLCSKVTTDSDQRLSVQAMVLIARGLGRKTVAEGVEDAATAAMLKRLGVDYGQGYFFGRPMPWSALEVQPRNAQTTSAIAAMTAAATNT